MARSDSRPTASHALTQEQVAKAFSVDPGRGLDRAEAASRLSEHGPNRLRRGEHPGPWSILLAQLRSVVTLLLAGAAALAFPFGQWIEGVAILAVIGVNAALGFASEWRAVRSMEALRDRGASSCRVRREGRERRVDAADLVPGDTVLLDRGEVVPADLRLLEAEALRVNEAALTGETVPVEKSPGPAAEDAPLAERPGMLHKGTEVAEGRALGLVVATGMGTEIGRVSALAARAESVATPLQQRLDALGRRLAWITLVLSALIAGVGLLTGRPPLSMIETAIALGVAAIPEGLPIVATIALARGMHSMSRRHALVRRLTAVETLGATGVILSDKTGTLTENRMRLQVVRTADGEHEADGGLPAAALRAVEIGVLCNNAELRDEDADGEYESEEGDPTEVALLRAGVAQDLHREALLEERPEEREVSFDPDTMMMATYHRREKRLEVAVKGAPGAVLEVCDRVRGEDGDRDLDDDARQAWRSNVESLARRGLLILAVADKEVDDAQAPPYRGLRLVGLVGLLDPPREQVAEAVRACRRAGIRVVMVTGDQAHTAAAIARRLGLVEGDAEVVQGRELRPIDEMDESTRSRLAQARVFARVSPAQKLRLVQLHQERGEIVAMTGDGVNDAPALKKAEIGVAMGERGTDAARQVSEMVLQDDAFSSIVAAVRQGRVLFDNIRKSVLFMLCTNVAEIVAVAGATLAGLPLPLTALQILFLNVLTDVFPALALGVGAGSGGVMDRPPLGRDEPVLTASHWRRIAAWSAALAVCVLTALVLLHRVLGLAEPAAVTGSFATLAFAKLFFVFNLRAPHSHWRRNEIVGNRWIWGALFFCAALLVVAVHWAPLQSLLRTRDLGPGPWGIALGLAALPFLLGQVLLSRDGRRGSVAE